MYNFPFVVSYQKLKSLFDAVVKNEVPDKFTYRYLEDLGFASSKDRDLLPALKSLGFLDQKGIPTQAYADLKDPRFKSKVIRKSIDFAYEELFKLDSNVENVSENVLNGYFSKLTGASHQKCRIYTGTFRELVKLSNHQEKTPNPINFEKIQELPPQQNVNININLPITTNEEVYRELFKHLKGLLKP